MYYGLVVYVYMYLLQLWCFVYGIHDIDDDGDNDRNYEKRMMIYDDDVGDNYHQKLLQKGTQDTLRRENGINLILNIHSKYNNLRWCKNKTSKSNYSALYFFLRNTNDHVIDFSFSLGWRKDEENTTTLTSSRKIEPKAFIS